jgi:phage baseplate assembly protein W
VALIETTISSLRSGYSDLDFSFGENPGTGDVNKKTNAEAIKQSVRNLLLTKQYERPFQDGLYSQLYDLLFENFTSTTRYSLDRVIRNVLSYYEPRINVLDVNISNNPASNALAISLSYEIISLNITTTQSIILERTR